MRWNQPDYMGGWKLLIESYIAQDNLMGANSYIRDFLAKKGYVLANINTNLGTAKTHDDNHTLAQGQMENLYAESRLLFDPTFKVIKAGGKFFKAYYVENPKEMINWTFTVNHKNQLVYPKTLEGRVKQIVDFRLKHLSYEAPAVSPATNFFTENQIDIDLTKDNAEASLVKYNLAKKKSGEKENLLAKRNLVGNPEIKKMIEIGNVIIGINALNPANCSIWGMEMDATPQAPVEREYELLAGASRTLTNLKLGSFIKNTGDAVLLLYKGKVASPVFKTINPGGQEEVTYGYGTSTLHNNGQGIPAPGSSVIPTGVNGAFKATRTA